MCEHLQDTVGNTKLRDSPGGSSNRSLLGHTQFHPAQKGAGLETKHAGRKQGHFFPTNQHSRKYCQQGTSSLLAFQMTCQVQGPKTHIQQVQENMLEQRSPTFLASRTGFVEDNFSSDQVRGEWLIACHQMYVNCHWPLTDRVLIWVCKQLIYYGLCAVKPLCSWSSIFAAAPQREHHPLTSASAHQALDSYKGL